MESLRGMVTTGVITVLGIYAAFVMLMYLSQSSLLYLPEIGGREPGVDPGALGLPYEDVRFDTEDGEQLHGWWVSAAQPRGTLLFFHGNAGNIGHRLDSIRIFIDLGFNVFIFDYRGYGLSSGRPSEPGLYRDAQAAWDWLTREKGIDGKTIVLFGRSLGGAIAANLAARTAAAGLIVESSFTSVPDLGAELYPFMPVRLLSRFRYDTREKIGHADMPVLVVHSRSDEIIPIHHGQALYAAAKAPKQFLEIQGGHNDGYFISGDSYRQGLEDFLESLNL